jgi:hypothetical protein
VDAAGKEWTHFDIIGSGHDGYGVVRRNRFTNSAGNYIDLEGSLPPQGDQAIPPGPVSVIFVDNTSTNHLIGGVYAAGVESLILRNTLRNRVCGSYIGYDGMTQQRARNIVAFNTLERLPIYVYDGSNGDAVARNSHLRRC